jgi:heme o synthase
MAIVSVTRARARTVSAYVNLAKPRGILPHLITAAAAMFLAAGGTPPITTLVFTLVGGGLVAGAANTFNSYLDRDIDTVMVRTQRRPLPSRLISPNRALTCGIILGITGVSILSSLAGWAAAALAIIALLYYVIPYTLWLKRRTYWATIIGSGIGAIPPLIGWAAVSPHIALTPFLLSGIIILWTIPHFWALALFRREDYEKAGLKVLPVKGTATWIIICTCLLTAATIVLARAANLGVLYTGTAAVLGAVLLALTLQINRREPSIPARTLYRYSIFYIAVIFLVMIIDKLVF